MTFKHWLINFLLNIVYKLEKGDLATQFKERHDLIGNTIYRHLPALFSVLIDRRNQMYEQEEEPIIPDLNIIEDGSFNYFELPSKKLPKFDFVCPQIPLYVYIGGPETASFDVARKYGYTKSQWDSAQADLEAMKIGIPNLANEGKAIAPKLVIFTWEDTCSDIAIIRAINEALNGP